MKPIYLDYNATTPVREEVLEEMLPFLKDQYGNPSSSHLYGDAPSTALSLARQRVSNLIAASPEEIYFTGSGSESDNLALKGVAEALHSHGNHIITTSIEHPAILQTCRYLQMRGFEITFLPVDTYGMVSPQSVAGAITDRTILVSVMHANNETGTIQPIDQISQITRERGILLHTDAAQSIGKIPVNVNKMGVDILSIAAHKFYAPKGVGALYIKRNVHLEPLIHGGGQEAGMRAGTENVAFIAGLGKAAELAGNELQTNPLHLLNLRDELHALLQNSPLSIHLNGHPLERLPNTLNISFERIDSANLLAMLPEIAASTGSACHSDVHQPSSVLLAMGMDSKRALGAIRFSVGIYTAQKDIQSAANIIHAGLQRSMIPGVRRV
jgi:cysteine desulfurase